MHRFPGATGFLLARVWGLCYIMGVSDIPTQTQTQPHPRTYNPSRPGTHLAGSFFCPAGEAVACVEEFPADFNGAGFSAFLCGQVGTGRASPPVGTLLVHDGAGDFWYSKWEWFKENVSAS